MRIPSSLLYIGFLAAFGVLNPTGALAQKHLSRDKKDPFAVPVTPNNRKLPPPTPEQIHAAYEDNKLKLVKLDSAMAPALDTVRKSLKLIQRRWMKGLPKDAQLFVTTRVYDTKTGQFEHVLVRVDKWMGGRIFGTISSVLALTNRYKPGQIMNVDPVIVVDWKIKSADGSEEGNFVAKFLAEYYAIQQQMQESPDNPVAPAANR